MLLCSSYITWRTIAPASLVGILPCSPIVSQCNTARGIGMLTQYFFSLNAFLDEWAELGGRTVSSPLGMGGSMEIRNQVWPLRKTHPCQHLPTWYWNIQKKGQLILRFSSNFCEDLEVCRSVEKSVPHLGKDKGKDNPLPIKEGAGQKKGGDFPTREMYKKE